MGFGGEVAHRVDPVTGKYLVHASAIADIRPLEEIPFRIIVLDTREVIRISRVGELVNVDDPPGEIDLLKEVSYEVAPDEAAPARDHEVLYVHPLRHPIFHAPGFTTSIVR